MSVNQYFDDSGTWRTQSAWRSLLDKTRLAPAFGYEGSPSGPDKDLRLIQKALKAQHEALQSRLNHMRNHYNEEGALTVKRGFNQNQSTPYSNKTDLERASEIPTLLLDIARGETLYEEKARQAGEAADRHADPDDLFLTAETKAQISQMLCDYGVKIDQDFIEDFRWSWLDIRYDVQDVKKSIYEDIRWSQVVDQDPAEKILEEVTHPSDTPSPF